MKKYILIVSLLASCLVFVESQSSESSESSESPGSEVILGFIYDSTGVTFQVESNGCTEKSDFVVLQLETYPVQVMIERTRPDNCEVSVPYGEYIKFTYEELGQSAGTKFDIGNQINDRITIF